MHNLKSNKLGSASQKKPQTIIQPNMDRKDEEQELLQDFQRALSEAAVASPPQESLHPAVVAGIGGFLILNVGLLLSLPPVLMGRGAPYLPTFKNKMDKMFAPLKSHYSSSSSSSTRKLTFVDLGSGDGRVVFRAAREGLFHKSIGYEINPCKFLWHAKRELASYIAAISILRFFLHTAVSIISPACGCSITALHSSPTVFFKHEFCHQESLESWSHQGWCGCRLWSTSHHEGSGCQAKERAATRQYRPI